LLVLAAQLMIRRAQGAVFRQWWTFSRRHGMVERSARRILNAAVAPAFVRWAETARILRTCNPFMRHSAQLMMNRVASAAWCAWAAATVARRAHLAVLLRATQQMLHMATARTIHAWAHTVALRGRFVRGLLIGQPRMRAFHFRRWLSRYRVISEDWARHTLATHYCRRTILRVWRQRAVHQMVMHRLLAVADPAQHARRCCSVVLEKWTASYRKLAQLACSRALGRAARLRLRFAAWRVRLRKRRLLRIAQRSCFRVVGSRLLRALRIARSEAVLRRGACDIANLHRLTTAYQRWHAHPQKQRLAVQARSLKGWLGARLRAWRVEAARLSTAGRGVRFASARERTRLLSHWRVRACSIHRGKVLRSRVHIAARANAVRLWRDNMRHALVFRQLIKVATVHRLQCVLSRLRVSIETVTEVCDARREFSRRALLHLCASLLRLVQERLGLLHCSVWLWRGRHSSTVARVLVHSYCSWGRCLRQQLAHPYQCGEEQMRALLATHCAFSFLASLQLARLRCCMWKNSRVLIAFGRWQRRTLLSRSYSCLLGYPNEARSRTDVLNDVVSPHSDVAAGVLCTLAVPSPHAKGDV